MNNQFDELTKKRTRSVTRPPALKKFGVGLAIGCALLCLTAPLQAGEQVPFNGTFNPVILSATPVDDSHVHLDLKVTARATLMGNLQGAASITLNVTDLTYVGTPSGWHRMETQSLLRSRGSLCPLRHPAYCKM
jgi:hypothetical protein